MLTPRNYEHILSRIPPECLSCILHNIPEFNSLLNKTIQSDPNYSPSSGFDLIRTLFNSFRVSPNTFRKILVVPPELTPELSGLALHIRNWYPNDISPTNASFRMSPECAKLLASGILRSSGVMAIPESLAQQLPESTNLSPEFTEAWKVYTSGILAKLALKFPEQSRIDPAELRNVLDKKDVLVFCDGACINNGKPGALASWAFNVDGGMYNGHVSYGKVESEKQTNNRGEGIALLRALEFIRSHIQGPVTVVTDSMLYIRIVTLWMPEWFKLDPEFQKCRKISGSRELQPVANSDIIKSIYEIYAKLDADGMRPEFTHIQSHQKTPADTNSREYRLYLGNFKADADASNVLKSL